MTASAEKTGGADSRFRLRYETLRSLLNRNNAALLLLNDLEADLSHLRSTSELVRGPVWRLIEETLLMAEECNLLAGDRYRELYGVVLAIMAEVAAVFQRKRTGGPKSLAVPLESEEALDPALAGGKAAGLAMLGRLLKPPVPAGFVLTTAAYDRLIEANHLEDRIRLLLKDIEAAVGQPAFAARTETVRSWIRSAVLPGDLAGAISEHAARIGPAGSTGWAVRSSAVFEGGQNSFAGVFESRLRVAAGELAAAYLDVVASRFLERAVMYRIQRGIREVEAPMAVLFMPMIEAAASGIVVTADPLDPDADAMILNAVAGLGGRLVAGAGRAHAFRLSREANPRILDAAPPAGEDAAAPPCGVPEAHLLKVAALAFEARERAGFDLELEWSVGADDAPFFLQARRMTGPSLKKKPRARRSRDFALIEGGFTIFPGRAEGPAIHLEPSDDLQAVPKGTVALVTQPAPVFAPLLPRLAAMLAVEGSAVGHLATLAREFSVPSVFGIGPAAGRLAAGKIVSVDAASRQVYEGSRWPDIRERVLARVSGEGPPPRSGPLYDLILRLNLTDPDAPSFKAKHCRSIHDAIRFMHEMSVRFFFAFGDCQKKGWKRKSRRLNTDLPMRFFLVDLDRGPDAAGGSAAPAEVDSVPFQAFWKGFADERLPWPERWKKSMMGLPSDFREAVLGGYKGPRRASDANYVMVGRDYLNFNARFAYHYTMVDAIVGPGAVSNHVYVAFRGGGASGANRACRAAFLERVLRQLHFDVDRRGDLVAAWLRSRSEGESAEALALVGRLLICARQLDAVLPTEATAKLYAGLFLEGRYEAFA